MKNTFLVKKRKFSIREGFKELDIEIDPSDGKPQNICPYCFNNLKKAVAFRTMYMDCQVILENGGINLPKATPVPEQVEEKTLIKTEDVFEITETYEPEYLNVIPCDENSLANHRSDTEENYLLHDIKEECEDESKDFDENPHEVEIDTSIDVDESTIKVEPLTDYQENEGLEYESHLQLLKPLPTQNFPEQGTVRSVRTYKRKNIQGVRGENSEEAIQNALEDIRHGVKGIREAGRFYGIAESTLRFRWLKFKKINEEIMELDNVPLQSGLKLVPAMSNKHSSRQIFTKNEEDTLSEYLIKASALSFGLTLTQLRELAYEYAKELRKQFPENWEAIYDEYGVMQTPGRAGKDWCYGFIKRNKRPEFTSLAQAIKFDEVHIEKFFCNFHEVMERHNFPPERIWNIDELGLNTVLGCPRMVAKKGTKHVGQSTSNECGAQITFMGFVCASGRSIPPVYLFPRKNASDAFMDGSPEGSIGIFNDTGHRDKDSFLENLKHLKNHAEPTKDNPILLLLDYNGSHCHIQCIEFCRENGIVMVSFPPYSRNHTQPLNVSIYDPIRRHCNALFYRWMTTWKDKASHLISDRMIIKNLIKISGRAISRSFNETNIKEGFRTTGIYPYDKECLMAKIRDLPNHCPDPVDESLDEQDEHLLQSLDADLNQATSVSLEDISQVSEKSRKRKNSTYQIEESEDKIKI
ncbi:HTH CenpB-type DNA-binding domain [Sergentomyia squamirostris]